MHLNYNLVICNLNSTYYNLSLQSWTNLNGKNIDQLAAIPSHFLPWKFLFRNLCDSTCYIYFRIQNDFGFLFYFVSVVHVQWMKLGDGWTHYGRTLENSWILQRHWWDGRQEPECYRSLFPNLFHIRCCCKVRLDLVCFHLTDRTLFGLLFHRRDTPYWGLRFMGM